MAKTNKELLVRIDERQTEIRSDIKDIKSCLDLKLNKLEFMPYQTKTDKLWDDRNRMIGWLIGASVGGSGLTLLFQNLVKVVLANY